MAIEMSEHFRFHHIGYATKTLEREREFFRQLGYVQAGESFSDDQQGVFGCFLEGPGPRLELLENLPGFETLTPWLNAGIGMYHLAYEVQDLAQAEFWARARRGRRITEPLPAVAFNGRRICFYLFRDGPMLEFIEA